VEHVVETKPARARRKPYVAGERHVITPGAALATMCEGRRVFSVPRVCRTGEVSEGDTVESSHASREVDGKNGR